MAHEARGDHRQAIDCYRQVIDFIRAHPDDYDPDFLGHIPQGTRSLAPSYAGVCRVEFDNRIQLSGFPWRIDLGLWQIVSEKDLFVTFVADWLLQHVGNFFALSPGKPGHQGYRRHPHNCANFDRAVPCT
jgi:hypothetical protein